MGLNAWTHWWSTDAMSGSIRGLLGMNVVVLMLRLLLLLQLIVKLWGGWWWWRRCWRRYVVSEVLMGTYSGVNSSAPFWAAKRWCWGGGVPNRGAVTNWATAPGWFCIETEGFWERALKSKHTNNKLNVISFYIVHLTIIFNNITNYLPTCDPFHADICYINEIN